MLSFHSTEVWASVTGTAMLVVHVLAAGFYTSWKCNVQQDVALKISFLQGGELWCSYSCIFLSAYRGKRHQLNHTRTRSDTNSLIPFILIVKMVILSFVDCINLIFVCLSYTFTLKDLIQVILTVTMLKKKKRIVWVLGITVNVLRFHWGFLLTTGVHV